jgi:hypothetical protein
LKGFSIMPRSRCSLAFALTLGLAVLAGPLLAGCGGEETKAPPKEEDIPAAKGKDSMDFYRKNNPPRKGATK